MHMSLLVNLALPLGVDGCLSLNKQAVNKE